MAERHVSLLLDNFAPLLANSLNRTYIPISLDKLVRRAHFQADDAGFQRCLWQCLSEEAITGSDLPDVHLLSSTRRGLCVAPCYLHADRDTLRLFNQDLQITEAEAQQLIKLITPLLEEFSAHLYQIEPELWLMELASRPAVEFTALDSLHGQAVTNALPTGEDAARWIRLWNEMQMLLFNCELNKQREQQGKLPINSVWFWGQAAVPNHWRGWKHISGLQTNGLDELLPIAVTESAQGFSELTEFPVLHRETLVLADNWEHHLHSLETDWFAPLLAALQRWKISSLEVIVPELGRYRLTPWSTWALWR